MTEKEKYAKHLEQDIYHVQLPINNSQSFDLNQGRRIPLGKLVTQMEMRNPEARQQLKEMLEFQMQEKKLAQQQILSEETQYRKNAGQNRM